MELLTNLCALVTVFGMLLNSQRSGVFPMSYYFGYVGMFMDIVAVFGLTCRLYLAVRTTISRIAGVLSGFGGFQEENTYLEGVSIIC
jgi:hypothetical protein